MFGLDLSIISGLVGIVSGLIANWQKASAEQHKLAMEKATFDMEMLKLKHSIASEEFKMRVGDKFSSMTRRILVLAFMGLVILIALTPLLDSAIGIAIPVERTTGAKYLFGLIDTTRTQIEYELVNGYVLWKDSFDEFARMIFAFYVGASAVKR